MAESKISPITFGIAGVIGNNASATIQRMMPAFRSTPKTVVVKWMGDDFSVVTYQHCDDAQLAPGKYEFSIPNIDGYQGIILGQFFDAKLHSQDEQTKSWPEYLSAYFVSSYAHDKRIALTRINGAFAGVLWEQGTQQAILIRDGIGIIPLYASEKNAEIIFSSDLRAFRCVTSEPLTVDEQAVAEFLHYLYVPAPRSIYEGIQTVLPGHNLIMRKQTHRQVRYSPIRFVLGQSRETSGEIAATVEEKLPEFEMHLKTALQDMLPKKGRVGLLLSGGKDSSTLAIALSQIVPPERILAFTVGFEQEVLDESHDAARLCEFLKIPHQIFIPRFDQLADGIFELVRAQDQPFGDPAGLPLYLGLEHMPEDVDVVWDGTGTDYYFGIVKRAGWKYYHLRRQVQKLLPEALLPLLLKLMSLGPRKLKSLRLKWKTSVEETFTSWDGWSASELTQLFGRDITFENTYLWDYMRRNALKDWRVLQTDVVCHIRGPHAPYRKVFHIGQEMGRSVRFPFIDNRLASFVNGLPQEFKFSNYENKILLRAYLSKYLPQELLQKPKGSFSFDLNTVLQSQNNKWLQALLDENLLKVLPFGFDQAIEQLMVEYQDLPTPGVLYRLYALALISTWIATVEGKLE